MDTVSGGHPELLRYKSLWPLYVYELCRSEGAAVEKLSLAGAKMLQAPDGAVINPYVNHTVVSEQVTCEKGPSK